MRYWLVLTLFVLVSACGSSSTTSTASQNHQTIDFFPLSDGNIWNYEIRIDGDNSPPTLGNIRSNALGNLQYEVRALGGDALVYQLRAEGIFRMSDEAWLIREPLEPGNAWDDKRGRTFRIIAVDTEVSAPIGKLRGCIEIEETGGESQIEVKTTYCPNVGPVVISSTMVASTTGQTIRSEAKLIGCSMEEPKTGSPCIATRDL